MEKSWHFQTLTQIFERQYIVILRNMLVYLGSELNIAKLAYLPEIILKIMIFPIFSTYSRIKLKMYFLKLTILE